MTMRGEHILGVGTVGGRLRMTELTHDPAASAAVAPPGWWWSAMRNSAAVISR
ncbi:hypothetical protein [Streptomyces javensis]|uniref:Uncharacterized protein n=1 Tax=Streptomyces javensis TaxID=114698 RepID=A0ABS0RNY4_9ACTN|nr:hypothetical protein [Streptomyces javensis]MBI0318990.1 hypothetical protein [Streptomyces javensis]